jgi:hypothetical protein
VTDDFTTYTTNGTLIGMTVDGIPSARRGVFCARPLIDLLPEGDKSAWRFRPDIDIDLDPWLRRGDITTTTGQTIQPHV